jgi:hexosaminidase
MLRNASFLTEYIKEKTGLELSVTDMPTTKAITLALDANIENSESYRLEVDADGVSITGASPAGVFYGVQTLRKALPVAQGGEVCLPAVTIADYPRFEYRGAHLDVSRHFFAVDSVKRFIDMLALHNMNRFHWHLTDDQGWRIEIKKYPKLSTVAAERDETVIGKNTGVYDGQHYGPFLYTQEEFLQAYSPLPSYPQKSP